ncbi:hypothetical protein DB35_02230 [Streptomyces abyssalis]|uniref:Uncharacterized protein n=1 Tax=Streptomyces abyssalis TaxID=933944 RepID=A0A1E7JPH4_9ACTN|nr:SAVMC3_10250 family protein [Streptomyces abyssalis]OEU90155.1 hypothetical protein AN215_11380 [Streptomyces abyssalis]OEU94888.1 hypothetical protein DB35_02230 [Streptomyces abyssalis]
MNLFGRGKRRIPLKYYLYISQSKLDNLLPQIPQSFIKAFETEFKVSAGVLGATVRGKPGGDPSEVSARVGVLDAYLRKSEPPGSVAQPGRYIAGAESFRYGIVHEYASQLAFFGGPVDGVRCALIGSPDSLVGAAPKAGANHAPYYYTLKFLNALASAPEWQQATGEPDYYSYPEAVDIALQALSSTPPTRLEFLAKTLHVEPGVVVATPIYVAMAD